MSRFQKSKFVLLGRKAMLKTLPKPRFSPQWLVPDLGNGRWLPCVFHFDVAFLTTTNEMPR